MTGRLLATLRESAQLSREEIVARTGISLDQVGRIERGDDVGLWYVMAYLAVVQPLADKGAALLESLKSDGADVLKSGELRKRRKDTKHHSAAVQARASDGPHRPPPVTRTNSPPLGEKRRRRRA